METLLNRDEIKPLFSGENKIRNEADLLLPDGSWKRPDRLVIHGKKVQIVEYKTGHKKEAHKRQIGEYEKALSEMGFEKIEKYLIYTSEEKIVKV